MMRRSNGYDRKGGMGPHVAAIRHNQPLYLPDGMSNNKGSGCGSIDVDIIRRIRSCLGTRKEQDAHAHEHGREHAAMRHGAGIGQAWQMQHMNMQP